MPFRGSGCTCDTGMKRRRYAQWVLTFWAVLLPPAAALAVNNPAAASTAVPTIPEETTYAWGNANVSKAMQELMRSASAKYIEGSSYIRSGDSEKAREAFNEAVEMLLNSDWDLASTPTLDRFFQEIIQRIQEDESMYLPVEGYTEDDMESAAVDELDALDLVPITVDPSLRDALAADLLDNSYEIPITINEMVMKSLNYLLSRGRRHFEDGLLRSGQYRPLIEKIFREESIPLDLIYLAQVESFFKPHALSKAKAKGIWQFERATAIRYGLKVTRDVDERSDPEKSTRAAARYLKDLFGMFKDWNLALAAYNWGEGKVQRLVESTGIKDFWELVNLKKKIPLETKNHVPLVQASVILGRNPEKFGLPTELQPPLEYTEVSVSKPIDLRAAAKILGVTVDELKRLNPALRGLTTPANYPGFQLKVPVDVDPGIEERLAALPKAKIRSSPEYEGRHKVRRGETLSRIAARYRVSVAQLAKANDISRHKILREGTWLRVPSPAAGSHRSSASSRSVSSAGSPSRTVRNSGAGRTRKASERSRG